MSPVREPHSIASRALLASAFFLSGAAALAYEVAWSRALLLVLGSTAASSAVVLGTFVGALGLGARWGGRRAERHDRPLLLYGVLEIGAGLWALLAVPVATLLEGPYVALAGGAPGFVQVFLRVFVAVIVIAPAAFLLGATLPAMVRHWVRRDGDTGRQTAWLYGANTLGAVAGCFYTGFFAVAAWGVTGTVWRAALTAILVGVVTAVVGARSRRTTTDETRAAMKPVGGPERGRTAALAALFCGFAGLGIEVVGFRILVFFLEGFTVTFAAMLGVFILGLGLGSLVLGPVLVRTERPARTIGSLLLLVAATLLFDLYVVVPSLEHWMHSIRDFAYARAANPEDIAAGLRVASVLGASLLFLVPAILLGPTFALCVRWAELAGAAPGHAVGRIYLWNSAGSLAAPLLCGFLLMPLFHVAGSWFLLAVLLVPTGLVLVRWRDGLEGHAGRRSFLPLLLRLSPLLALGVGALLLSLGIPGTDAESLVRSSVILHDKPERRFVHAVTDSVTTASVIEGHIGERYLYTDDFAAAATGRHYRYMRMLGHLPAVLAHKPENAMVIAFGTGTTAGAVARHPEVKRLEVVEVSTAVLDLAGFFVEANRDVLDDERVEVVPDDGRNALLLHEPDLDLITLEPLMPYAPAGYPFYTREFYELAKARLREGGVLCQWIPVHAMPPGLYAAFLRAFYEVFPDGSLWFFEQSTALIGRKGTTEPSPELVRLRLEGVADDLRDAGFETPTAVLSGYLAEGRGILAAPTPPSFAPYVDRPLVDMDPFPEFAPTPRASLNTPYLHQTLAYLLTLVDADALPDGHAWWLVEDGPRTRRGTLKALAARYKQAQANFLGVAMRGLRPGGERHAVARDQLLDLQADAAIAYEQAGRLLPHDSVLRWRLLQTLRMRVAVQAQRLLAAVDALGPEDAERRDEALRQVVTLMQSVLPPRVADPDPVATGRVEAALLHAAALLRLGRCTAAEATLRAARAALADELREEPLNDVLDALLRLKDTGTMPSVPDALAWVVRDAAPCRAEGTAPVAGELEGWKRAVAGEGVRALRTAARRLASAARREGCEDAVAAAVRAGMPAGDPAKLAVAAALLRRLDPVATELAALLLDPSKPLFAPALVEAGRWKFAKDQGEALEAAARGNAAARRALAGAAAESGHVFVLRRAVDLLMDDSLEVRSDAWSAFLKHRADQVQGYDPKAGAPARKPIVDALREALGG